MESNDLNSMYTTRVLTIKQNEGNNIIGFSLNDVKKKIQIFRRYFIIV